MVPLCRQTTDGPASLVLQRTAVFFNCQLQSSKIRINFIHIQLYFTDDKINSERLNALTKVTYHFYMELDPNPDSLTPKPVLLPLSHNAFKSNMLGERERRRERERVSEQARERPFYTMFSNLYIKSQGKLGGTPTKGG